MKIIKFTISDQFVAQPTTNSDLKIVVEHLRQCLDCIEHNGAGQTILTVTSVPEECLIPQAEAARILKVPIKKVGDYIRHHRLTGYTVGSGKPGAKGRVKVDIREVEAMKK